MVVTTNHSIRSRGVTKFAERVICHRGLTISNCPSLESTPKHLHVGAGLVLERCEKLVGMGHYLNVGQDLVVTACNALVELPAHVNVGGRVELHGNEALEVIRGPMFVESLLVVNSPSLLKFGSGLRLTNLSLDGCSSLVELPNISYISGVFSIANCRSLVTLPRDLTCSSLRVSNCGALKCLPESLLVSNEVMVARCNGLVMVQGVWRSTSSSVHVCIKNCSGLQDMSGLVVHASGLVVVRCHALVKGPGSLFADILRIKNCDSLVELKTDLRLKCLYLSCKSLTTLPSLSSVLHEIELFGCNELEKLPHLDIIARGVTIRECASLKAVRGRIGSPALLLGELPSLHTLDVKFRGKTFFVRACPALKEIRGCIIAEDVIRFDGVGLNGFSPHIETSDLEFRNCASLVSLGDTWPGGSALRVFRNLRLEACGALKRVPNTISLTDNLTIEDCDELESLDHTVRVGCLVVRNCGGLQRVAEVLSVKMLHISECKSLAVVCKRMELSCDIRVEHCAQLVRVLGSSDAVGLNSVMIHNCPELVELSSGEVSVADRTVITLCGKLRAPAGPLCFSGDVDIVSCGTSRMLSSDFKAASSMASVRFEHCGDLPIDPESINIGQPINLFVDGVKFTGSPAPAPAPAPANLTPRQKRNLSKFRRLAKFWTKEAGLVEPPQVPVRVLTCGVIRFFERLQLSEEYSNTSARPDMARVVLNAMELLKDDACSEEIVLRMEDSLDACNDKPALALNQIYMISRITRARGDRAALFELGSSLRRLGVVHRHAIAAMELDESEDVVSYIFEFEIELRQTLALPVALSRMIYRVNVPPDQLQAAALEACNVTEEENLEWLDGWCEWQRQERLETVEETCWKDLDVVQEVVAADATDMCGDPLVDPVSLRGGVWSYADLGKHWVTSGNDLLGAPLSVEEFHDETKRVEPVKRRRTGISIVDYLIGS